MALNGIYERFWTDILNNGVNRMVSVFWDDSTNDFVVKSWDDFNDEQTDTNPIFHASGRTALSSDEPYLEFLITQRESPFYQPCVGTTLLVFNGNAVFPYATKTEVLNSPKCNIVICDLTIIQPIQTTPSDTPETANGTATVVASSSFGPVTFSLTIDGPYLAADSVLGNEYTKNYSSLSPGIYDIFTTDAQGCTAQSQFEVSVIGDYQTKYYSDTTQNNRNLRINIKERGYANEPVRVPWVEVRHKIGKLNDPLFKVIRGGSLDMTFIATQENELLDLTTSDERQFLVEYTKDAELFFRGFILSDLAQRPLGPAPYNVTFSATDQLGTLRDKDFLTTTGETITGFLSMLDVIRVCVAFTDLNLPINSGANIYEVNQSQTDTDDPLTQQYLNTDQFRDVSCYEVIERTLINYKIYQWAASWYITPIAQTDPYYLRQFIDGIYQINVLLDPVLELKSLGTQEKKSSLLGNKEAFLTQREPFSQVNIKHDFGAKPQLIFNGDFDLWETNLDPIGWQGSAIQQSKTRKIAKANESSDFVLRLDGEGVSAIVGEYIECTPFNLRYEGDSFGESFKLAIKAQIDFIPGPVGTPQAGLPIRIEFDDAGTLFYLDQNGFLSNDPDTRIVLNFYDSDLGKFIEAELDLVLPSSNNLITAKVRIYQAYEINGVTVNSIKLEYVFINYFVNESPIALTETIKLINPGINVSFKPQERTVYIGSLPNLINAVGVYENGIFDQDGNVMREWNRQGLQEQLDYAKIYGDNLLNTNIKRTNKITCRIVDRQGGDLNYYNLLVKVDGVNDDIKYIINAWDREEGSQIASLEIIELVKGFSVFESELPFRLLEDGESRILEDNAFRLLESE